MASPRRLPPAAPTLESLGQVVYDLDQYIRSQPTVEIIGFDGVIVFPIRFAVDTKSPAFVALNGRASPDDGTQLALAAPSWFREAGANGRGSTVVVESIDGLSDGDGVTLTGIVVGTNS